jgi:AcrR family transcriptional regulator
MPEPAYTRLHVDERRRRLLEAGSAAFAEHAFEEISMREIAAAAGVSKALLYHYFPSKADLFAAAVEDKTLELRALLEPPAEAGGAEALASILRAYLQWIERNERMWLKLMQSAASLPAARDAVDQFRSGTRERILSALTEAPPPPALRNALSGWLGSVDASIIDWVEHRDLTVDALTGLLFASFAAALLAAQQADPAIRLRAL